jgi:hypothetical protein
MPTAATARELVERIREQERKGLDLTDSEDRAALRTRIATRLRFMRLRSINGLIVQLGGTGKRSRGEAYRELARCIINESETDE